ncbi:hypothetical protein N657DRAFT_670444 [Parathielavia appendiculata]|uniref:Uncharacterized protein n=1 Tax=Parathielavia appendiculata TaxID=2587402 RepID=A0AAN6Z5Y1_9PEZI|nr:hypothetical protein N657DRAFT_670444 [Parathielavia appendiculata]
MSPQLAALPSPPKPLPRSWDRSFRLTRTARTTIHFIEELGNPGKIVKTSSSGLEAEIIKRTTGQDVEPVEPKTELDGGNPWGGYEEHRHLLVRAIVKGFLTTKPLSRLPKCQTCILVRDIQVFNYVGARIIDFSRSWTMPHPSFMPTAMRPKRIQQTRERDPHTLRKASLSWILWEKNPTGAKCIFEHKVFVEAESGS